VKATKTKKTPSRRPRRTRSGSTFGRSTTNLEVKVKASDRSGNPLDQHMDIEVHTEVDQEELDLSTTVDADKATSESYALKVSHYNTWYH